MNYKKILRSLVLGLGMVLVVGGVAYAVTTVTGTLQFDGTTAGATEKVDFGTTGASEIYDDWNLHIVTDDNLYLDVPGITVISNDVTVAGDLAVTGTITGTSVTTGTTATTFTFGSGSDADLTDMILNLGGTDPAILSWIGATRILTFGDNFAVTGTLGVTGATTIAGALRANGNVDLGNASTDTIDIEGDTTITDATVPDDSLGSVLTGASALTVRGTLAADNTSAQRGIAGRFVGKITGPVNNVINSGLSSWLYVHESDVTMTGGASIYSLWVGIEEDDEPGEGASVDADLSSGIAAGISIYTEFGTSNPPSVYPIHINTDTSGHGIDALIYAPNAMAIGLVEADPGTADDAYVTIEVVGQLYRIPLFKVP